MSRPAATDTYHLEYAAMVYLVDAAPTLPLEAKQLIAQRACTAALQASRRLEPRPSALQAFADWRWPALENDLAANGTPWEGHLLPSAVFEKHAHELRLLARLEREGSSELETWLRTCLDNTSLSHLCQTAGIALPRTAKERVEALVSAVRRDSWLHAKLSASHENCRSRAAHRAKVKRRNMLVGAQVRHLDVLEQQTLHRLRVLAPPGQVPFAPDALDGLRKTAENLHTRGRPFELDKVFAEAQDYMACTAADPNRVALLAEFAHTHLVWMAGQLATGSARGIVDLLRPDRAEVGAVCPRCSSRGVSSARSAVEPPPYSPLCRCEDVTWLKSGRRLDEQWQARFTHWALADYCGEFVPALWLSLLQPASEPPAIRPAETSVPAKPPASVPASRGARKQSRAAAGGM